MTLDDLDLEITLDMGDFINCAARLAQKADALSHENKRDLIDACTKIQYAILDADKKQLQSSVRHISHYLTKYESKS